MMRTIASSGSKLGSTPNSKSFPELGPAVGAAPVPPSSSGMLALLSADRMGEEMRASERRWAPGATVRRCLTIITIEVNQVTYTAGGMIKTHELSELLILSTKAFNTLSPSPSPSSIPSPKATISTATLFFFNFLANLTMAFSSRSSPSPGGDPTKTIMR